MNAELVRKALEKVENPHVLVNLVSRRVRQLNAGGRPLLSNTGNLGVADIALLEIIEDKLGFRDARNHQTDSPGRTRMAEGLRGG